MPGFTSECMSGLHQACADKTCRCPCHPWTQELLKHPVKKADPTGGVRRDLPPDLHPAIPEVQNTCPRCGRSANVTDIFCRDDGTRLMMGKQCLGCGAPQQPEDKYCWQCSLKAGEKPAPSPERVEAEDVLMRTLRTAREQGLLRKKENDEAVEKALRETTV